MAPIFIIGYVWDYENEEFVRPRFLLDGEVVQGAVGEIFARFDGVRGAYEIEMVTKGYTFDSWDVWEDDPYVPEFLDKYANPTTIIALDNCYYYCMVYPTPDPFETVFVETYREVDIYQYVLSGWYQFTFGGVIYAQPPPLSDVRAYIDDLIEAAEEPQFIETYRGVDIYWLPTTEIYRAEVQPGWVATGATLQDCKDRIDEIIEFLETPPLDPGSILEQLLSQVMIWVDENLAGWLAPIYDWIDTKLAAAKTAWETLFAGAVTMINDVSAALTTLGTELWAAWDVFWTETLPGIWDTVDAKIAILKAAVLEDLTDLGTAIDTKLANLATYVDEKVAAVDTVGFFEDPVAYISGVFAVVGLLRENKIIESFLAGFEEGLDDG